MRYLKIQTLDKGWCDKDCVLLHAAFQILVDFMKDERPERIVDWASDKSHRRAWKEIRDLYKWWTHKRPARNSPLDDKRLKIPPMRWKKIPGSENREMIQPDRKKYRKYYEALKKYSKLERKWEDEDQRNLHRLIEIRGFLWT